jgi:hypothetical protein
MSLSQVLAAGFYQPGPGSAKKLVPFALSERLFAKTSQNSANRICLRKVVWKDC